LKQTAKPSSKTNPKGAYEKAGVNRDLADQFVGSISTMVKSTLNKNVKSAVGGYAALYALNSKQYIAASTDGVGTKLKLAFDWDSHSTVGIDLVAMSVNDLLCVGAKPLFFLDYFATGRLKPKTAVQVLAGIVQGCREGGCALIGGETAEMPGFYEAGEYDLAGFAVGLVDKKKALPAKNIKAGDVLIGISSSGFHSNGYSLIRKLFKSWKPVQGLSRKALAKELLKPTQIYTKAVEKLITDGSVKGLAHITGSGFLNVPRMSSRVSYDIVLPPLAQRPKSFRWLETLKDSSLTFDEKVQTFNMGIGMVIACEPRKAAAILAHLKKNNFKAWDIGTVTRRKQQCEVVVRSGSETSRLVY
jgi:phosphoribosylformylglycinamidine cyclo-ligase